jgi:transposase
MDHVAIDLGGRESQICRRGPDGQIVEECRRKTRELRSYLVGVPQSRVIVETCAEAFGVADIALELGHEVRVVPATLAPQLGVGARKLKTDRRDARALSEVSCKIDLPSVYIPSSLARERHSIIGLRSNLVSSRTALVNSVRGYLRGQALNETLRAAPEQMPKGLRLLYQRQGRPVPRFVERQLEVIEALNAAIQDADKDLEAIVKADPNCRRLTTAPGVGPVTAVLFAAIIDDATRFPKGREIGSYVGLTPGERSSSDTVHRLSITKAGPRDLRWVLVQAAWSAQIHYKDDPLVQWAQRLALKRGKGIATVALARKLAVVLHAMWRDGADYQPRHRKAPPMAA